MAKTTPRRILVQAVTQMIASLMALPAAANHDGIFDIAAVQQDKRAATLSVPAAAPHWLARFHSWLRETLADDRDQAARPQQ